MHFFTNDEFVSIGNQFSFYLLLLLPLLLLFPTNLYGSFNQRFLSFSLYFIAGPNPDLSLICLCVCLHLLYDFVYTGFCFYCPHPLHHTKKKKSIVVFMVVVDRIVFYYNCITSGRTDRNDSVLHLSFVSNFLPSRQLIL